MYFQRKKPSTQSKRKRELTIEGELGKIHSRERGYTGLILVDSTNAVNQSSEI